MHHQEIVFSGIVLGKHHRIVIHRTPGTNEFNAVNANLKSKPPENRTESFYLARGPYSGKYEMSNVLDFIGLPWVYTIFVI